MLGGISLATNLYIVAGYTDILFVYLLGTITIII